MGPIPISRSTHSPNCGFQAHLIPRYGVFLSKGYDLFFGLQFPSDGGEPFHHVTNWKASGDSGLGAPRREGVPPSTISSLVASPDAPNGMVS